MTLNIVISTGAGISAESGIHTYRDADGLWQKHDPEVVSHIQGWKRDPQKVLDFKNALRRQFVAGNHQPNPAHHALARLQRDWRHGRVTIVTQNIDGLHEAAGSTSLAIHGNATRKKCDECGLTTPFDADIVLSDPCPGCGSVGTTRPDVVLFGEVPHHLDDVVDRLRACHILAVIGSSLQVSPANTFVLTARRQGASTVLINKDLPSEDVHLYQQITLGPASVEVPRWVEGLFAKHG